MKTEHLQIRITSQLKEKARELANKEGKGLSEWVIDLIKLEIAEKEKRA